jgi:conjugal transfer mating pair stabilization protein TraN
MGVALDAAGSAAKYVGGAAIDRASAYVFDAMYSNSNWTQGMMKSFLPSDASTLTTNFASQGFSLGAYGFTWTTNVAAYGKGIMGANTTLISSTGASGVSSGLVFNPYVFAAMVAIQVIQNLASCSQDEQMLALHKGVNLSRFVIEECSIKIPITNTCIEWTSRYCSFNSVLAKIINTQGKPQLGLPLANCQGLSTDQLAQIDFSKIDFSEFSASIINRAQAKAPTNMGGNYTPIMQSVTQGSAQNNPALLPNYIKP